MPSTLDELSEKKDTSHQDSPKLTQSSMKRVSMTLIMMKEKNNTQIETENFLSYQEYAKILKDKNYHRMSKLKMQKLIPSIMPHTMDIKSDYKMRNEL